MDVGNTDDGNDDDGNEDEWQDTEEEDEELDLVPKRQLIAQSDWTNSESANDDAEGQISTGKPYDPFDSIIEAVNLHDTRQFRECTAPKYKASATEK